MKKVPTIRQILRRSTGMEKRATEEEIEELLEDIIVAAAVTDQPDRRSLKDTCVYWERNLRERGLLKLTYSAMLPEFNSNLGFPSMDAVVLSHYELLRQDWNQSSRFGLLQKGREIQKLAMKSANIVFSEGARRELQDIIDMWRIIDVVGGKDPEGRLPATLEEVEVPEEVEA